MSKRGLGRGLSALIPNTIEEGDEEVREVAVDQIAPNPKQPRTDIDDDAVAELADSVRKVGILQAIIVRPYSDGYQIIAGERRWRAARMAGLERVPVRVLNIGETESLELALIENLQREDLNPMEEARGFRRLLTDHQMTQAELADKVSKSRSAVTNALRLLDLPEEVQGLVYEGALSAGHARTILSVPDEAMRVRLAEKVVAEGLSVRDTENMARLFAAGQAERAPRPQTPKSFKIVARKLRRILGTGVRVKQTQQKGKIEIEFHGEEELERIFKLLTEGEAPAISAEEA
ncbi:MAG: ParB/RepB/Spo0J family partition protein [Anaerosomatales bacterium]|nr:ParB/RepB/Spo0J family partition protein [Anaerosomatales bacterium]MDT8433727.1 ParB/RepB/Spo0J family partition protein [Anaerosomatales bacterium]